MPCRYISSEKMAVNKTPMNGVYVKGSNIVSTDGWQMNRFKMEKTELPEFWISDSSVDELLKIKSFEEMQLNGNWVNFKTKDGLIISLKTLNTSQFPYAKVEKLLEVSQPKETDFHSKFPQELFNVIDRATSFGIDISERVAVRLVLSYWKFFFSHNIMPPTLHSTVTLEQDLFYRFQY